MENSIINGLMKLHRKAKQDKDEGYYRDISSQHPYLEAGMIALVYCILGVIWLTFPDNIIAYALGMEIDFRNISIFKAWSFVFVSAALFFIYLLRRLLQFQGVLKKLEINLNRQKRVESELNQLAYYDVLIHDLGLKIIAEGIETEAQLSVLEGNQCDYGQGYLFSRPVPAEEFDRMIKNENKLARIAEMK